MLAHRVDRHRPMRARRAPTASTATTCPAAPIRCLILGDSAAVGYGMTQPDADAAGPHRDQPVPPARRSGRGPLRGRRRRALRNLHGQINLGPDCSSRTSPSSSSARTTSPTVCPAASTRRLGVAVVRWSKPTAMSSSAPSPISAPSGPSPSRCAVRPLAEAAPWPGPDVARSSPPAAARCRWATCSARSSPASADIMFGTDRFHPSATGYANMVSRCSIPAIRVARRSRRRSPCRPDARSRAVADAAAESVDTSAPQVRRSGSRRPFAPCCAVAAPPDPHRPTHDERPTPRGIGRSSSSSVVSRRARSPGCAASRCRARRW